SGEARLLYSRPSASLRLVVPLMLVLLLMPCAGEIIDRVAVTVENSVITESEILRQIRLTAFFEGEKPDYSLSKKREVADRLVEQMLVRKEISEVRYGAPEKLNPAPVVDQIRQRYSSREEYLKALAAHGLTEAEVEAHVLWQLTLLNFIDQRLRPGVQVSDAEVEDYYRTQFLPQQAKISPESVPSLEESREKIEEILMQQRVNQALDRWLGEGRRQTNIRFRQEVFQ
ncbi:MAG: hypothetical protein ACRD7E_15525, partial [Bryobacteraceae bacterium]